MSHHHPHRPSHIMRIFIACSPSYRNRRAIMEALGSIFFDTIEQQREYYYFDCPAMDEIFEDGVFNRANFRRLAPGRSSDNAELKTLDFTYIVAGGDDGFIAEILSEAGGPNAVLVRLA